MKLKKYFAKLRVQELEKEYAQMETWYNLQEIEYFEKSLEIFKKGIMVKQPLMKKKKRRQAQS